MLAESEGESAGLKLAKNAEIFLRLLSEPIPDAEDRLNLLKFFGEQTTSTQQAQHLASGHAHLFLTPHDMNLKLNLQGGGPSGYAKV